MAHLALSDLSGQRFYHDERLNRAGPGIAGIDQSTGTIWNGNWQVQLTEARQTLRGLTENFEIQLNLTPAKPPVIHGRDGISQKAAGAGHASHYISFSRLLTSGSIELNGASIQGGGHIVDGSRVLFRIRRYQRTRMGLAESPTRRQHRGDALSPAPQGRQRRSDIHPAATSTRRAIASFWRPRISP